MEICSDPYGCGCRAEAEGGMRVWRIDPERIFDEPIVIQHLWISLCRDCGYWDSDHDWDGEPDGPAIPSHVKRFEMLNGVKFSVERNEDLTVIR
jgi:hypothetical protein